MSAAPDLTYQPRPTKERRTKAAMQTLRKAIYETCSTHHPLTCRNLFYLLVTTGYVEKTEAAYKTTVIRLAGLMREEGELPWRWLVDSTRWMRKPQSYTGLQDLLEQSAKLYRRDLWAQSDQYVEVWCESESIAGVIGSITEEYDVPLMPARGFSSKAFLFGAAETIAYYSKPTTIYYVGDYDASGIVAKNDVYRRLSHYLERWFNFTETFDFREIAVTEEQIVEQGLPTKPPKTRGNTHAQSVGWREDQGTVEAEAMEPARLRMLLREAIESHIGADVLGATQRIEAEERATLARMAGLE